MTVRYCIGELVELGCQTAKKARITDATWSAVKGLGINRSVRGTRAGKSVQRKKTLIRNATPATTFSPPSPSPLDPRTANPGPRVEPVRPRTIQRRHLISIGTFNSRTLTDDARLLELVKLAKDMKLDVLAIQEHRRRQVDELPSLPDGYNFLACPANDRAVGGIAFLLSPKSFSSLLHYRFLTPRQQRPASRGDYTSSVYTHHLLLARTRTRLASSYL